MENTDVLKIGETVIGKDSPPFVIAEISANHGGSLAKALEIVDLAAVSGANGLANVNATSTNYVGYFWSEVPGFSKFGTFTANANTDGPFIYCGFKPRFVLGKDITSASTNNWFIFDTARDTYNGGNSNLLRPNLSDAELANANRMDILSNGFKVRGTALPNNTAGDNYIFMAFADKPFGNVNGTAR